MAAHGGLSHTPMILATMLAALVGLIIWFIVRRQKQRFWLPILRVIPLELTVLPKLRWMPPPLWPLLCFAIATVALGIYSFQLSDPLIKTDNLDLRRTHVYFDLSPSNSLALSTSSYGTEAQKLLGALEGRARLSFSTSADPNIYSDSDSQKVRDIIRGSGYHRAGVKLGAAVEALLRKLSDIDHLIVVSDRDLSSWEDFNWRYLEKKMQISWYPLPNSQLVMDNVFIDEAKPKVTGAGEFGGAWSVTLRRTGQGRVLEGKLSADLGGKQILSQNWQFEADMKSLELDLNLPMSEILQKNSKKAANILWITTPSGPDDLLPDNEFRSWVQLQNEDAMVIARPRGEMFLEDSVFHLKTSLEVLGYQTQRVDQIRDVEGHWTPPSLIVAEVGPAAQLNAFCPLFAAERSPLERSRGDVSIWLLMGEDINDYGELCTCFAALAQAPKPLSTKPGYCENLEHRDQYVSVLQSIGALQLGGQIGSPLGAVAMSLRNREAGLRILGFTVPLNPMRAGQVSYGQLPLMLRAVLEASGVKQRSGREKLQNWPRIEDITQVYDQPNINLSNVPMAESLGRQAELDQLPRQLTLSAKGLIREQASSGSESDARPWVYLCLALLALSVWLEILGLGLAKLLRKHPWVFRWFVVILLLGCDHGSSEAGVQLNLLGYSSIPKLTSIRKDVAGRTSIELDETLANYTSFQAEVLHEPWLWVNRPQIIESLDKTSISELAGWLQRGGFLVVENYNGSERIKQAILNSVPKGSWKPIPPDHELMRSFHLLASLPQCANQVWEGFHFDQRIAIVLVPGDFLRYTLDDRALGACFAKFSHEQAVRVFINLMMVALATDYKKDQIHLPEILKRLR